MNISIRQTLPEDVESRQNVFYKTWLDTYPNKEAGITKEDIEKYFEKEFTSERIASITEKLGIQENKVSLVARDGDKGIVIGLCNLTLARDHSQLQAIYVLPEYQNFGVGSALWDKALTFLDKEKPVIVQVATYNKNAIAFYEKHGFVDTGKRLTDERFKMPISGSMIPEMEMVLKK